MASGFRISLSGLDRLRLLLATAHPNATRHLGAALYQEAQAIMAVSQRQVPVRYGILKASGHVFEPEVRGNDITVTLGYGGAASPYSVIVHERIFRTDKFGQTVLIRHDPPTKAKFLEDPALAAVPDLARNLYGRVYGRIFPPGRFGATRGVN